jgi:methylase of polypeptide subunit release factors
LLEHGADQADVVAAALVAAGYARVRCHRDLAGRDRVTEGRWLGVHP